MKTLLMILSLSFAGFANLALANELPVDGTQASEIPTTEREFVATINTFDKAKIVEQFGEPSQRDDLALNEGKGISVWHYHYLNTDANGAYYQTTELDFVDDKVVMVVFMNNNGEEIPADAVKVPTPTIEPDL